MFEKLSNAHSALNSKLPEGVRVGLGTVYLHTDRGLDTLDRLSNHRFWDYWHDAGIVALVASMLSFVAFLMFQAFFILTRNPESTPANNPKNVLAIPGVNDFIPLEQAGVFVLALFIAMIVHEGGHAIASRREGIQVDEWGVILFVFIPIGAYVLPDEEDLYNAPLRSFSRVLSAGIMNNYAVTALSAAFFLFVPGTPGTIQLLLEQLSIVVGNMAFFQHTNLEIAIYWVWFININLAVINTLPVSILDGGQISSKALDKYIPKKTYNVPINGVMKQSKIIQHAAGVFVFILFMFLIIGPTL